MMDMGEDPPPLGWISMPMMMHSSREFTCKGKTQEQCDWYMQPWHFWYVADWQFGHGTIYFCLAMVGLFMLGRALYRLTPKSITDTNVWRTGMAAHRYLAYRTYRVNFLRWYPAPLGVLILGAISFTFFFAMMLGPKPYYWPTFKFGAPAHFGDSQPLATRSGWMALALLPFVVILPMKLNIITQLTGVSHEKMQTLHHWAAWLMLILGLVHTFPFIIMSIKNGEMMMNWATDPEYQSGVGMLIPQAWLTFLSWAPIRNRFYEFFRFTHFFVGVVFMVTFFVHCEHVLTSWDYFIATAVLYVSSYAFQLLRTYLEYGITRNASITLVAPNLLRIAVPTPNLSRGGTRWHVGQHMFLRFLSPKLGWHAISAHPFTICSHSGGINADELVFFVRPRKGLTGKLAALAGDADTNVRCVLDGPYGGMQETRLASFDDVLLVVGGSGVGFSLPVIEDWLQAKAVAKSPAERLLLDDAEKTEETMVKVEPVSSGSSASSVTEASFNPAKGGDGSLLSKPATLRIVLSSRDPTLISWYTSEVSNLLKAYTLDSTYGALPSLDIHVTTGSGPYVDEDEEDSLQTDKLSRDASRTLRKHTTYASGRPNLAAVVSKAADNAAIGGRRVGVTVCGPLSMMYDVRNACASAQGTVVKAKRGELYLHSEVFGW